MQCLFFQTDVHESCNPFNPPNLNVARLKIDHVGMVV